jgi:hypothetical protein
VAGVGTVTTFEHASWRPVGVGSHDARRAWWNVIAPTARPVTQWPFPAPKPEVASTPFLYLAIVLVS